MLSSFTLKLPHLLRRGALCRVTLKPSAAMVRALKAKGKTVPSIKGLALLDTGSNSTAISHKVIRKLKLVPRGMVEVYTSNKVSEIRKEYDISLAFDTRTHIPLVRVLEASLKGWSIDCLIGRDVLRYGVLIYDGPRRRVKLTFRV